MVFNLFHSNGRNSMHLFHQLPAFTTDHTVICKHHSPLTSSVNHHDWYKNRLRCQYNSTRTLKPHLTAVLLPSTPSGFSSSPDILIQYHSYLFMFLKIDTRVLSTFLAHSSLVRTIPSHPSLNSFLFFSIWSPSLFVFFSLSRVQIPYWKFSDQFSYTFQIIC